MPVDLWFVSYYSPSFFTILKNNTPTIIYVYIPLPFTFTFAFFVHSAGFFLPFFPYFSVHFFFNAHIQGLPVQNTKYLFYPQFYQLATQCVTQKADD
ncbi:unnamed protein product [Meloidogyne enterolobii]|uniref:Uncharacterized protein n=1 Tax=Meloidogyne enterolobii TaxID=390850 RepID=A0ACB0ZX43_MELEN